MLAAPTLRRIPELSEAREAPLRSPQVAVDEERGQLSRNDVGRQQPEQQMLVAVR
jgi:hypothetical protein